MLGGQRPATGAKHAHPQSQHHSPHARPSHAAHRDEPACNKRTRPRAGLNSTERADKAEGSASAAHAQQVVGRGRLAHRCKIQLPPGSPGRDPPAAAARPRYFRGSCRRAPSVSQRSEAGSNTSQVAWVLRESWPPTANSRPPRAAAAWEARGAAMGGAVSQAFVSGSKISTSWSTAAPLPSPARPPCRARGRHRRARRCRHWQGRARHAGTPSPLARCACSCAKESWEGDARRVRHAPGQTAGPPAQPLPC